ncbi:potassium channel family protein [Kitasatospora sp. NPDC059577]|uniref:potassium channel family protein n=1 Tax=Kitasatospora sp. NPDC059577 TaxID=3346873 RepID=UPI003673CE90
MVKEDKSQDSEVALTGWKTAYITRPTLAMCGAFAAYWWLEPRASKSELLLVAAVMLSYSLFSTARVSRRWLAVTPQIQRLAVHVARLYFLLGHIVILYLLGFATLYLALGRGALGTCMNIQMNRASSLYFTLTVFTTTGFGDISPSTDGCRMLVSAQMFSGFALVAIFVVLCLGRLGEIIAKPQP